MPATWACYVDAHKNTYCRGCAPLGTSRLLLDGVVSDRPAHCEACGKPLCTDLTEAGFIHVLSAVVSWLELGARYWNSDHQRALMVSTLPHYADMREVEVVRDWASMAIEDFAVEQEWVRRLLRTFIFMTMPLNGQDVRRRPGKLKLQAPGRRMTRTPEALKAALAGVKPTAKKKFDRYGPLAPLVQRPESDDDDDNDFWKNMYEGKKGDEV